MADRSAPSSIRERRARARAALCGLVLGAAGCATGLPIMHSLSTYQDDDDDEDEHADPNPGKFTRCEIGYYLAGLAIDAIVIGGDVMIGEELNGWDALVIGPFGLDALVGTSLAVECLMND